MCIYRTRLLVLRDPSRAIETWTQIALVLGSWHRLRRTLSARCGHHELLLDTGQDYLDRGALPLRSKRSLALGVENERASWIDRVGAEDTFIFPTGHSAGLATFSLDETNACST